MVCLLIVEIVMYVCIGPARKIFVILKVIVRLSALPYTNSIQGVTFLAGDFVTVSDSDNKSSSCLSTHNLLAF